MKKRFSPALLIALSAVLSMLWAGSATGQTMKSLEQRIQQLESRLEGQSKNEFHITGYASTTYLDAEGQPSAFSASFNPLFLFKAGERFLFEAELEFSIEEKEKITLNVEPGPDGKPVIVGYKKEEELETEVRLEYAQIDYMFSDNLILVTGKFLLPFGIFGERGHPTWINKLPSAPPIYGGHGGFGGAIIPVLSDFGVQLRGGIRLGASRINYAVYTVNGPRAKEEEVIGVLHGGHHGGPEFAVDWEASTEDNNNNKAFGLRVGYSPMPIMEFGLSYYNADADQDLVITLSMIDFSLSMGNFEVRSEYLKQDTADFNAAAVAAAEEEVPPEDTEGYYVQASYSFGIPEIVARFGAVENSFGDVGSQTAVGVNFWLETSLVLKLSAVQDDLEDEPEKSTKYFAQLAQGF